MDKNHKNKVPIIAAVAIALVVLIWYTTSGRSSLDKGARELVTKEEVSEVNLSNPGRITINCKNGESYEILFTEEQSNYDDLIFNACGEE